MKRFRFQFATLEKVRKAREDEAVKALAEAQAAQREIVQERGRQISILEQALIRREELGREAVSAMAFEMETLFILGTKQRVGQADHAIQRSQKRIEKCMRAFLDARRRTRMVEVLREKALERFKKDQARHEQKTQDDLYVMRAQIKQAASAFSNSSEYSELDDPLTDGINSANAAEQESA